MSFWDFAHVEEAVVEERPCCRQLVQHQVRTKGRLLKQQLCTPQTPIRYYKQAINKKGISQNRRRGIKS